MSVAVFGTHLRSSLPAGASRLRLGRLVMNVSHLSAVDAFVSIMFASPGLQFARVLWNSCVSTNYERATGRAQKLILSFHCELHQTGPSLLRSSAAAAFGSKPHCWSHSY